MKRTFENYLIMVGIRTADYTYTDEQIFDNTEYFKKCYDDNLSAYKALLFLHDHLQEVEARDKQSINYNGLLGTVPDSLFGNECRNHKCVYNVAATCKNRDIGKACKGHCA